MSVQLGIEPFIPDSLGVDNEDSVGLDFDPDPNSNIDWSTRNKTLVDEKQVEQDRFIPLVDEDEGGNGDGGKKTGQVDKTTPMKTASSPVQASVMGTGEKKNHGISDLDLMVVDSKNSQPAVQKGQKDASGLERLDDIELDFDPDPNANIDWSAGKTLVDESKAKQKHFIPLVEGDGGGYGDGGKKTGQADKTTPMKTASSPVQASVMGTGDKKNHGISDLDLMGVDSKNSQPAVQKGQKDASGLDRLDDIDLDFDPDPNANIDWSAGKTLVNESKAKQKHFIPLVEGDGGGNGDGGKKTRQVDKTTPMKTASSPVQASVMGTGEKKNHGISDLDLMGVDSKNSQPAVQKGQKDASGLDRLDDIDLDFDPDPNANIDWSAGKTLVNESKTKQKHFIPLVEGGGNEDGNKTAQVDKTTTIKTTSSPPVQPSVTGTGEKSHGISDLDLMGVDSKNSQPAVQKGQKEMCSSKRMDDIGLDFDEPEENLIDWSEGRDPVKETKPKEELYIPLGKGDEGPSGDVKVCKTGKVTRKTKKE